MANNKLTSSGEHATQDEEPQASAWAESLASIVKTLSNLVLWFILLAFLYSSMQPRLRPTWSPSRLLDIAIIFAFPFGAFMAARGVRSGIPFLLYDGCAAFVISLVRLDDLMRRYVYDLQTLTREIVWISLTMIFACRIAASIRWRLARRSKIDREPRCKKCGYLLIGLPEPRCPECGEPFERIQSSSSSDVSSSTIVMLKETKE